MMGGRGFPARLSNQQAPGGQADDGQYRIRAGHFRFRYDIKGQFVYLKACSLRREDTY
jgi:mRNA-degrading endonuclease RelE of RelBE toxin-antitoxin system